MPDIPLGAELARALEALCPEASDYAKPLSGKASAHLDVVWRCDRTPALLHDLRFQLRQGRYEHPNLPLPVEQIEAVVRSRNGDITIDKATAKTGQGTIVFSLDLPHDSPATPQAPAPSGNDSHANDSSPFHDLNERVRSIDLAITKLVVAPSLFDKLPGKAAEMREMFMPSGRISLNYAFRRQQAGWQKRVILDLLGMDLKYRGFPYQVHNARGRVVHTASEGSRAQSEIDLLADGAGSTVSVKGTMKGSHPDVDVDLRIAGNGVSLDRELIDAMPDDNPALLRRMHATARGDFVALIRHNERTRREYGPEVYDNHFTINVRQATMTCEEFPYPLENMTGTLIVRTVPERPTRLPDASGQRPVPLQNADTAILEFRDFHATRHDAKIRGSGRKDPATGGSIMQLNIDAESMALDEDFHQALSGIRMDNVWRTVMPSGRINLSARVKLYTKTDPHAVLNAAEDLELSVAFAGGAAKPTFFPYELRELAGRVAYAKNRVDIRDFHAKHGASSIGLPLAEVIFRPSGGYWADLRHLQVDPLVIDQAFLEALTPSLRSACESLELKGASALHATRVVLDEQIGPFVPHTLPGDARGVAPSENEPAVATIASRPKTILPTIYWDGRIDMKDASMKTGVDWDKVQGSFASWGLYKGDHLGAVRGNIVIDRGTVAKQPVEAVTASLRVDPRQPDVLSIPAIRGKLYNGDVGGEAWVVFDSPTRYALQLNAARVRLGDIARQYQLPPKANLEGLASAQLYLANRLDERTGQYVLQGGGAIDVPNGKLLNLPVLLNLIKVIKLRIPDDTGFEEAHALFNINGDRVKFQQLDLIGNAISLGGEGEMKTDGTDARFEFYPIWTKMKEMFALSGDWTGAISKKFLKIKVTGDLDGKLDYRAEPVPGIVGPVKRVLDRHK